MTPTLEASIPSPKYYYITYGYNTNGEYAFLYLHTAYIDIHPLEFQNNNRESGKWNQVNDYRVFWWTELTKDEYGKYK